MDHSDLRRIQRLLGRLSPLAPTLALGVAFALCFWLVTSAQEAARRKGAAARQNPPGRTAAGPAPAETVEKNPPRTFTNSIGMRFVEIPEGMFRMGKDRFPLAFPVHKVTISRFWMSRTETTNAQFDQFKKRLRFPEAPTPTHPATRVSWNDCTAFCAWLSDKEGRKYRLPTEAEWEYAARGGLDQKDYPWGNAAPEGRARFGSMTSVPVGSYAPNGYGLYDLGGNVREWVGDWKDPEGPNGESTYYRNSPPRDPPGPEVGIFRVIRDGAYDGLEMWVYLRTGALPQFVMPENGFRVALAEDPRQ